MTAKLIASALMPSPGVNIDVATERDRLRLQLRVDVV